MRVLEAMRSWQHCGQEWTYVNLIHVDDGGRWAVGAQAIANALIQGHAPEGTMVPSPPPEREGMEVTDLPRLGVLEVCACGWEKHRLAKCTQERVCSWQDMHLGQNGCVVCARAWVPPWGVSRASHP